MARWGGEEFAVLLRDVSDQSELARRAVELQRAIDHEPIVVDGEHLTVEVSGGVTPLTAGASLDTLVEQADRALYAAKRRGRNRVLLASEITESDLIAERPEAIRIAEALAVAVGVREGAPAEHPAYVASLAARLARALHLDSRCSLRCELGGWLHDIGKLSVPERVLLKPTALDEEEWSIMRLHAELGEQIVERIPALHAAGGRDPPSPRALRRHGLSRRPDRIRDPGRGAHRGRGRHVLGDDADAAVRARRAPSTRRCTSFAAVPARSSTRPSWSRSRRCSRPRAPTPSPAPPELGI